MEPGGHGQLARGVGGTVMVREVRGDGEEPFKVSQLIRSTRGP